MMNNIKIPFGNKYYGKQLSEVPDTYIRWLLNTYAGFQLKREDIEQEAIKRGFNKSKGKWFKVVQKSPQSCGS